MEKLGLYYVATRRTEKSPGGNGGARSRRMHRITIMHPPSLRFFLPPPRARPVRRILFPDKCNVRTITSRKNHIFWPYFMEAAAVFLAHSYLAGIRVVTRRKL